MSRSIMFVPSIFRMQSTIAKQTRHVRILISVFVPLRRLVSLYQGSNAHRGLWEVIWELKIQLILLQQHPLRQERPRMFLNHTKCVLMISIRPWLDALSFFLSVLAPIVTLAKHVLRFLRSCVSMQRQHLPSRLPLNFSMYVDKITQTLPLIAVSILNAPPEMGAPSELVSPFPTPCVPTRNPSRVRLPVQLKVLRKIPKSVQTCPPFLRPNHPHPIPFSAERHTKTPNKTASLRLPAQMDLDAPPANHATGLRFQNALALHLQLHPPMPDPSPLTVLRCLPNRLLRQ
mmetsp:Transcript_32094/g.66897  ORF Transcript_32094/g.66897 Transcript_32094/m.66897 type:complete len:288 (+) Transcript_32094:248-1111(+)